MERGTPTGSTAPLVSGLLLGFLLNRFHEEHIIFKALKDGLSRGTGEIATSSKEISQRSSTSRTEISEDMLANGVQDFHKE